MTTVPPMTVVEPVTPASEAEHVLVMLVAWSASFGSVPTSLAVAVVVTEPVGPVVPWVLRSIGPVERMMGPAPPPGKVIRTVQGPVAVMGSADPVGGRNTEAVG